MQATDKETMEEIIAGYNGEDKYESTMEDISDLTTLIKEFFSAIKQIIESVKEALADLQK